MGHKISIMEGAQVWEPGEQGPNASLTADVNILN